MKARNLASDNFAGLCPEALSALVEANALHVPAYGADAYTEEASNLIRAFFETDCEVFFTFNGTAANSLALASLCRSYHSVICHRLAHIETDECGAPEFYSGGSKLITVEGEGGKIRPSDVEHAVQNRRDIHYPKPKVLSLTQATEVGTVYTIDEIKALGALTHGLGLRMHMDGARFANAVVELGCAPKDLTWKAGVDVICLGGVKNGLGAGEAVVFFDKKAAFEFEYRCKQAGQLASKMRFLTAPWLGLLKHNVWQRNASQANARARQLEAGLKDLPALDVLFPRQANSVFVSMPQPIKDALHEKGWLFYDFIGAGGVRLMCSWDTSEEDIDGFLRDVQRVVADFEAPQSPFRPVPAH